MNDHADVLTISDVARRSGFASSALRYYEELGLIGAERTSGGRRVFPRHVLRRLAFIKAARAVGISLEQIREELATLPEDRAPTKADWQRLSTHWEALLTLRIEALSALRDDLTSCIGCGCLSLASCKLYNPGDRLSQESGTGAKRWPPVLRGGDESSGKQNDHPVV